MSNVINLCKVNQYIAIQKLKRHPKNPRTIKPERLKELKESIIAKGFYEPILVWKKGGVILSGNHRLIAAQELVKEGWEFVSPEGNKNVLPVVVEDVDDTRAEEILLEANNHYAEWVEDKLRAALQDAEGVSKFGFTKEYVDDLLSKAIEEADEIPKSSYDQEDGEKDEEPMDPDDMAPIEEFESLILPKRSYEKIKGLLEKISMTLNSEWCENDGYVEAVDTLVETFDDKEVGLSEEKPKKKKKSKS